MPQKTYLLTITSRWLFWLSLLCLGACQSLSEPGYRIEFDQDAVLILANDEKKPVKKGEAVDLPVESVTVARPNFRTLTLVPIPGHAGSIKVHLPQEARKEQALGKDGVDAGANANAVAYSLVDVQLLIAKNRPDEALARIQSLWSRYPQFSYLHFLEASCFVRKGDATKARETLLLALKDFPDDVAGQALLRELDPAAAKSRPAATKDP